MKIQQIAVESHFRFDASRDDLEALKVCLHQMYHYQYTSIPKNLQGVTSRLMDTVEAAIRQDDEIQRKVREKP